MGLDFLRQKAEKFTQRRDTSKLRELNVEDLLSRGKPDVVVRVFRCLLTDSSAELIRGLALILRVESETQVTVLQYGRHVGHVLSEDIAELTLAMKQNNHLGGLLSVNIEEIPALDGVFTVRPKVAFKPG